MSATPQELFKLFFAELERREFPYVILHSYRNFPEKFSSDVDYAVRHTDLPRIYPLLQEVAARSGWQIVQTLQYETDAYYSILVNPEQPERFIKLDRTSHFTDIGCSFVPVDVMLDGRQKYNGFYVPRASSEFIYTLVKVFSKEKNVADYLPHLRDLWMQEPERAQQLFNTVFGPDAGDLREWFNRPAEGWLKLNQPMRTRNRYKPRQRLREWMRRARRILQPTGLRLAFLGPDGVGKSAVMSRLQPLLEPCFRQQRTFHFRPMLFQKSDGAPVTQPHGQPPRSTLVSWIKVLYYFCDHWLGFLFQQLPAKCRSTCILFDRNFDDLAIDQRRYRLRHSRTLVGCLRHLMPKPDLTFILDAPSATIHQRKPELPLEELDRQRAALRDLAASDPRYILVSAEESADQVARTICRHVIQFLAAREQKRSKQ